MEQTNVQKLARVLKLLVTIAMICAVIGILFAPALSAMRYVNLSPYELLEELASGLLRPKDAWLEFSPSFALGLLTIGAFQVPYAAALALFLMAAGVCAVIILWQARRVLDTIILSRPFSPVNAVYMKRAGICCLVISAAALVRLIWGFCYYRTVQPLLTYNALFIPLFAMGFLLCMVMSALFRQAAELKEENDLTI